MKVILTGATGFIGSEILSQLLSNPKITSVVAVSRRAPPASDPKLKTVLLEDFSKPWPSSVLDECAGADACIWAMGLATLDAEKNKLINRDFLLVGYHALSSSVPKATGRKLRFVYMSGILAEKDQKRMLYIAGAGRKVRGEVENQLVELGNQQEEMTTFVTRPAFVKRKDVGLVVGGILAAGGLMPTIGVDELAAATIGIATSVLGGEKQIWENSDLVKGGRDVLSRAN